MPQDDAPPGFTPIAADDAPPGFKPIKAPRQNADAQVDWFSQNAPPQKADVGDWFEANAPKQAAPSESKPQPSFWQRLKSAVTPPPELPEGNEFSVGAGEARVPGGKVPLRQGMAEADALTNVATLGMGNESAMGMPPGKLPTPTGALDAVKAVGEAGADIGRGLKDFTGSKLRGPGRVNANPGVPPTSGQLRPSVRALGGPDLLGGEKVLNAIIPENPKVVTRGGRIIPRAEASTAAAQEAKGAFMNRGYESAIEPAPPRPVGLSTSQESVAALPQEALPGIARGATSSTGAMPEFQIGKQQAAAIKRGIATASEPRSTGSEGRPATWTNETVTNLAGKGNRDAISQAIRRGLGLPENARYVAGDADYPRAVLNPREVTKFTPDGVPIRNSDNPLAQNPSSRAQIAAMAKGVKAAMSSTGPQPATPLGTPDAAAIEAGVKRSIANPSGGPVLTPDEARSQQIMQGIAKQRASESPTAEPQTPGGMVTRAPRPKAVPVAKQYASDIIDQAEGEMRGALELGNTMPTAGRYFAENSFEEHPLAGRYDIKAGERPGGTWSGISSQKGNIAGQYPWFNDPDISLSKLTSAIQQGKGALYERIVGKIAEGITKERGAATAAISEQIPQLRELAGQVQEVEPELAQALNDLADGKIGLAPDKLRAYVTEKISDATAAKQFAQAIDDAAAEPRSPGVSETHATVPPARPGSGEAGPATQAPELSTKPPGNVKPISFGETGDSGSHIGAIEPRPLRPGETLANPPRTSNQPTYNKDEAARYRKWISGLKRT